MTCKPGTFGAGLRYGAKFGTTWALQSIGQKNCNDVAIDGIYLFIP